MEHSDEMTFAEYFKSRYDLFRGLISFVVAMQWLIDHDFEMPTDAEIKELVAEANRKVLEAWGEIYALAVLKWLDGQ